MKKHVLTSLFIIHSTQRKPYVSGGVSPVITEKDTENAVNNLHSDGFWAALETILGKTGKVGFGTPGGMTEPGKGTFGRHSINTGYI